MKSNQLLKLLDIAYYENAKNIFQKAFISIQSNCSLCANNLEIAVSSNDIGQIHEEAFCKQCNLKLRSKSHIVQ